MITESKVISGLQIRKVTRHVDERGDFRELIRLDDPGFIGFGQLMCSTVYEGISKAWHMHLKQSECMFIQAGIAKFAFADLRKDSSSFGKSEDYLVDSRVNPCVFIIPPGIAHGYRIISGPAVIGYMANRLYDPGDQIKIAHDDPSIGYYWGPPSIK